MPNERLIDPLVSLSFSVYSNKGVYALLLGSGISRAAGIPTGWEVVIDLIHIVAKLEGEDCEPDPAGWYRTKHSKEPDYSKLLDEIVKTPTERQQLLRRYFEPTDEERNQEVKLPTKAHRAIAQLASAGYIRVIITTNFDRLTERALEDAGITPTVISTTDLLTGALPLAHSGVTVIKLHGDYLDSRIKNTEQELATYDKEMEAMLDRVLDEYGLIVSGWSGEWDTALRNAIARCPTRRFTTYWAAKSELTSKAQELTKCRRAVVLQTKDADHFFEDLLDKVQSLADMAAPHPLSAKIAVATVKRYLVDPAAKIRLHDLFHGETETLFNEILSLTLPDELSATALNCAVAKFNGLCKTLLSIFITTAYWGEKQHAKLLVSSLNRLINFNSDSKMGGASFIEFRRYPVLQLIYGAGIASIVADKYEIFKDIITEPKIKSAFGDDELMCCVLVPDAVVTYGKQLRDMHDKKTPVSQYLSLQLRESLRDYLPLDRDYNFFFDRFEYLWAIINASTTDAQYGIFGPFGCYTWRYFRNNSKHIMRMIDHELELQGVNWPPIKVGLFNKSLETAKAAKQMVDERLAKIGSF